MGSGASKSGSYKLTYFNGRGRAEITRLCFAAAGCPFEDCRIEQSAWQAMKPSVPLGFLPLLEFNGLKLCQSLAIARFVAQRMGLHGSNDLQSSKIDELVDTIQEITMETTSNLFTQDESAKQAKFKTLKETKIPFLFDYVEKTIKENPSGGGYIVGTKLSLADLAVFNSVETMLSVVPTLLDKYPNVKALKTKIEQNANIAKYLEKRNKTPF